MKKITIEELKVLQLDILTAVHEFCVKNKISYSLTAGTLLGAIRHHGYIPWDDDIDIMMPRPDYNRFINTFNGSFDNLYVICPELNWNFYAPYANVCDKRTVVNEGINGHHGIKMGVKIDVFPVDGLPVDEQEFIIKQNRIKDINRILYAKRCYLHKIPLKKWKSIIILLRQRFCNITKSYADLQKELMEIATNTPIEETSYVNAWVFSSITKRLDKKIFDNYIDVDFEGKNFKAVSEFDKYLNSLYGDYMQLPPEEKRVPHHGFTAYWKE